MSAGNITAWMPETDQHRLAALGKLIEECGELAARAARCIVQGVDELDPDTHRTNRVEMAREVSDVIACVQQLEDRIGLVFPAERIVDKFDGFNRWPDLIDSENTKAGAV